MERMLQMETVRNDVCNDLVSVVMPLYNAEEYVAAAIESTIAQSHQNWELIIVDDCSSDRSVSIVEQYRDARIRLIRNTVNTGAAGARNLAIEAARGRWIAFLDSDDLWKQDKLQRHLSFMNEQGAALSFTDYNVVDSSGGAIARFSPKKDRYTYDMVLCHNYLGCSTVIYDTALLGKVYMPLEAVKREDQACWLRILKTGVSAFCLHEALTDYRVNTGSVSHNKLSMVKYQWNVYRRVEKLTVLRAAECMVCWAVKGFMKYK